MTDIAYVEALARAAQPHPAAAIGAYANAGPIGGPWGWGAAGGPTAYAEAARPWVEAGATLNGRMAIVINSFSGDPNVSVFSIGAAVTLTNLRADGTLWRRATWASAWKHLFGKQGLIRQTFGPWRDYFKADFHPSHHDASASLRWLEDNRVRYQPVGQQVTQPAAA